MLGILIEFIPKDLSKIIYGYAVESSKFINKEEFEIITGGGVSLYFVRSIDFHINREIFIFDRLGNYKIMELNQKDEYKCKFNGSLDIGNKSIVDIQIFDNKIIGIVSNIFFEDDTWEINTFTLNGKKIKYYIDKIYDPSHIQIMGDTIFISGFASMIYVCKNNNIYQFNFDNNYKYHFAATPNNIYLHQQDIRIITHNGNHIQDIDLIVNSRKIYPRIITIKGEDIFIIDSTRYTIFVFNINGKHKYNFNIGHSIYNMSIIDTKIFINCIDKILCYDIIY